jgi:F-type H+-transporting ATPase subunit epsilon
MSELNVEIVTPQGLKFSGPVYACTAPGVDGIFQILPGHASLLSKLNVGEIKFEFVDSTRFMATSGGFLEVKANKVTIMAETAEWAEDIEIERARESERRARSRIKDGDGKDIDRARFALARALNRIHVSKHI